MDGAEPPPIIVIKQMVRPDGTSLEEPASNGNGSGGGAKSRGKLRLIEHIPEG